MKKIIYNHQTNKLSDLDLRMVRAIPSGGNWKNIPKSIPSKRLEQIRKSGGRTTYYGRLRYNAPSYTISTFFNRPGNGCYIHPDDGSNGKLPQDRLISFREAARLQSFPDSYTFYGTKTSKLKQIGNAVPPLLAKAIATGVSEDTFVDLFCGAGGMSKGFSMTGKELVGAIEIDKYICETFRINHDPIGERLVEGDITQEYKKQELYLKVKKNLRGRKLGIAVGGPPCQGFSLAGRRLIDDPRNVLFKEFVTIVDKLKPSVFIMENVPGLISMNEGQTIAEVTSYFRNLEYVLKEPVILKAENYGVPQKRRRLFILGHLPGVKVDFPPRKLFSDEENSGLPKVTTVYDGISDLTPIYTGLGAEEIEIKNWKPHSEYQELMAGCTSFDNFYSARK